MGLYGRYSFGSFKVATLQGIKNCEDSWDLKGHYSLPTTAWEGLSSLLREKNQSNPKTSYDHYIPHLFQVNTHQHILCFCNIHYTYANNFRLSKFSIVSFHDQVKGVGPFQGFKHYPGDLSKTGKPMEPNPTTGQLTLAVIEMKL